MSKSDDGEIKLILLLLSAGGGLMAKGLKRSSKRRRVLDLPRAKIASAPQGWVELQGHALPFDDSFPSVFFDRAAFRSTEVQKRVSRGKRSEWVTVFSEKRGDRFVLADPTGFGLVMTENCCTDDMRESVSRLSSLSPEQRARADALYAGKVEGWPSAGSGFSFFKLGGSSWRIRERVLIVGHPVLVHGEFRTAASEQMCNVPSRDLDGWNALQTMHSDRARFMAFFDSDRNGVIDERELQQGAGTLFREDLNPARLDAFSGHRVIRLNGVLFNSEQRSLSVIDTHEEAFAKRLRGSYLQAIAGALMAAAGLSWFLWRIRALG